jgi:hypothetical protein
MAITSNNRLLHFDTETPRTLLINVAISGLAAGEVLVGIDFRPSDSRLYALGRSGRLYTINVGTGAATQVATLFADPNDNTDPYTGLNGSSFGLEFSPANGQLRVVSDAEQNLRINVDTGAVTTDTSLSVEDPAVDPAASGAAYAARRIGNTTIATLYTIDSATDTLYLQTPENDGRLTPVGEIPINLPPVLGFDISRATGDGYIAAVSSGVSQLLTIDLFTGLITFAQPMGTLLTPVTDIAIAPPARLLSISARSKVGLDPDFLIAGFTVTGGAPARVIARALGPSRTEVRAASRLQDPVLFVYDASGNLIATNDNWRSTQQAEITATGLAPTDDREAAIVRFFPPGSYTVQVEGKNGTTGVAVADLHQL